MKISFRCQFLHGHATGTVGMKGYHLIAHTLQTLFDRLGRFGDETEKRECNTFFVRAGSPLAQGHTANGCCGLVQNDSGNAVHAQQIHNAVHHGDVFGADSVLHVSRGNG